MSRNSRGGNGGDRLAPDAHNRNHGEPDPLVSWFNLGKSVRPNRQKRRTKGRGRKWP